MSSVNKCMFIGNLGRDPEIKFLDGGKSVAKFAIACNEKWKDKSGEQKEHVEWVNVVAWGKLAELCGEYLKKGKQVFVEGRMQTRKWQDKEGKDRWSTEIVANDVTFLGGKSDGGGSSSQAPADSPDEPQF